MSSSNILFGRFSNQGVLSIRSIHNQIYFPKAAF